MNSALRELKFGCRNIFSQRVLHSSQLDYIMYDIVMFCHLHTLNIELLSLLQNNSKVIVEQFSAYRILTWMDGFHHVSPHKVVDVVSG